MLNVFNKGTIGAKVILIYLLILHLFWHVTVVEGQDIHELNTKYTLKKDIDQVHGLLTDYINNEKIEIILFQTLVFMERCLGNSILIDYLFHYGGQSMFR